jgi:hypothetical protein
MFSVVGMQTLQLRNISHNVHVAVYLHQQNIPCYVLLLKKEILLSWQSSVNLITRGIYWFLCVLKMRVLQMFHNDDLSL